MNNNFYAGDSGGPTNAILADGKQVDSKWELHVYIDDLNEKMKVRVSGTWTIGALMHHVVDQCQVVQSWQEHSMWWPQRNCWLSHTRKTLDQYGVQSDAVLEFRKSHGMLNIVLPSLLNVEMKVDYASRIFQVVMKICKQLNIRYPEELSLQFPVKKDDLKYNTVLPIIGHGNNNGPLDKVTGLRANAGSKGGGMYSGSPGAYDTIGSTGKPFTLGRGSSNMFRMKSEQSLDLELVDSHKYADCAFRCSAKDAFGNDWMIRPKNLTQKARLNYGWLDSSRSFMEHGIKPVTDQEQTQLPTLYLKFKFYNFYDLNPNYDAVRIHQLYEQARWSILSGLVDCTDDEMIVFAALQLHAELLTTSRDGADQFDYSYNCGTLGGLSTIGPMSPNLTLSRRNFNQPSPSLHENVPLENGANTFRRVRSHNGDVDEIDYLLTELEKACGVNNNANGTTNSHLSSDAIDSGTMQRNGVISDRIPTIEGSLKVFKDKFLGLLKRYKLVYLIIKEARLTAHKSQKDDEILFTYPLRDCGISQDVDMSQSKYVIKLSLLSDQSSNGDIIGGTAIGSQSRLSGKQSTRDELWIRCEDEQSYAEWIAACRLGSRGRTLASTDAYKKEIDATIEMLKLQKRPSNASCVNSLEYDSLLTQIQDFCCERTINKAKSKDYLKQRIIEAHINLDRLNMQETKLKYIHAWQRLPNFGRTYFLVQFDKQTTSNPPRGTAHLFSGSEGVLIAVCQGRLEIVSTSTGEALRAWNFSELKSWSVNWQRGKISLHFKEGRAEFKPISANCKTVVEFIGGYVFLGQRTPEKSQELNERLFHKLTGINELE